MVTYRRLIRFGLMSVVTYATGLLPASAQSYTPEQQQLCSDDAFRLCGPAIPDVDRVTACMVARRAELSPGCKSVFRYEPATPEPAARPARAGKPAGVKSRKAKKKPRN